MFISDEEVYLLSFHLSKGIGPVRISKILKNFGSFSDAYRHLKKANYSIVDVSDVDKYAKVLKRYGINIATILRDNFPRKLATFENLPKVIYYKGNLEILNNSTVGIVGTRYPSVSASNFAYKLSSELASNHITVVSGGAVGIDTAAHKGAVDKTAVVLGCGLNRVYPSENRSLFNEIVNNGGVILSEFPFDTPPNPGNFPARNRVISALSDVVVICQSPARSGALITARWALDQGKDVWAVPGDPYDMRNYGSNKLIYDGAKPLYDIREFIKEIGGSYKKTTTSDYRELDEMESFLIEFLRDGKHIEEIVERLGQKAYGTLLNLQVKGYVEELPGKIFRSTL